MKEWEGSDKEKGGEMRRKEGTRGGVELGERDDRWRGMRGGKEGVGVEECMWDDRRRGRWGPESMIAEMPAWHQSL